MIAALSSSEPSSTTTRSMSEYVCRAIATSASCTNRCPLCTGTITLTCRMRDSLLDGPGTRQCKTRTMRERWFPGRAKAAVSVTFDDARPSQLDRGIPILDRHGVRGTFYVLPRRVAKRRPGSEPHGSRPATRSATTR